MPLDLSVETATFREDEPVSASGARHEADHLFDTSSEDDESEDSSPGWDDADEATRVGAHHEAGAQSAALHMDWDEDEPPTRMRGDGMLDMPPISVPVDWDEANSATQIYDSASASAFSPASGVSSATTLTGGRPSPFPPPPKPLVTRTESLGAPSPFASTVAGTHHWIDALKAGDRRTWIWAGGGASGLIVLATLLRALAGSSTGVITITTTPSDAHVLVDGRPAASSSSPYSLSDLPSGKHDLLVQKPGFVDYHASFALARGEQKTLPPVELVASVREVGFSIRSAPPGAEVWIDGRATDQLTPAKFADVTAGAHRLQLKRPGYADYELQMIVPEATLLQLTADLVPTSNPAAPPPSAAVREKPARVASETSVSAATSASAHRSASYAPTHEHIKPNAIPFATAPASPVARTPVAAPAAAAPATGGRGGTLRINSRPWAQIFIDGRPVGNTPQPNLPIGPGNHKIQLVNQPMGLSKAFSVNVKPGDVVTKVMNLAE
jgi:hypothetical protein